MSYRQLRGRLLKDAPHLTSDLSEAEDLVQSALEKGVVAGAFEMDKPFAWLRRTMKNLFIDGKRKAAVRRRWAETSSEEWQADPESRLDVVRALDALPQDQAHALIAVLGEGYSYDEAGRCHGVPANTMKSRVGRGRRQIVVMLTVVVLVLGVLLWPRATLREAVIADHASLAEPGKPDLEHVAFEDATSFLERERGLPPELVSFASSARDASASSCTLLDEPVAALLLDDTLGRVSVFAAENAASESAFPGDCYEVGEQSLCEWSEGGWKFIAVGEGESSELRRRLLSFTVR